jgi:hypothetical protein
MHRWFVPVIRFEFALGSTFIMFGEVFSIFFMQRWGKDSRVQVALNNALEASSNTHFAPFLNENITSI